MLEKEKVSLLLDNCLSYAKMGKYDKTFELIFKAFEVDPENGKLWYVKENLLDLFSDHEKDIEHIDKTSKQGKYFVSVLNKKAHCHVLFDEKEKALYYYDLAIKIDPDCAESWFQKGWTLGVLQRFEEAYNCLDRAVALDPKNHEYQKFKEMAKKELQMIMVPEDLESFLSNEKVSESDLTNEYECMEQGEYFFEKRLFKNADICFTKAVAFNPENDEAWVGKGMSLISLRRFDEAVTAFDKALSIKEDAEYWFFKAMALNELEKLEEAAICYRKSLDLNPNDEDNWLHYGLNFRERRNYTSAIDCFKKAIDINPQNEKAWRAIGEIKLVYLNLPKEALYYLDKALKINPDNDDTWLMRGNALSYIDRQEEAVKSYNKALKINPHNSFAMENRGTAFKEMGKDREAIDSYKKAYKNEDSLGMYFRATTFFFEGKYEEVLECLDEEIRKFPADQTLWAMKGWALVKLAKYEEAMLCYLNCKYNVLRIFVSLLNGANIQKDIDERRQLMPYMWAALQYDDFFLSIAKQIEGKKMAYAGIYIRSLEIISLLYVNFDIEDMTSTYTNEIAANAMLFGKSPLRLSLITSSNDKNEGQSLLDYLYKGKRITEKKEHIEGEFGVFAACFTFNQDHLNQFRLYGKSSKQSGRIETGGVSLVVKQNFFDTIDIQHNLAAIIEKNKANTEDDNPNKYYKNVHYKNEIPSNGELKLSLFRCIYLDPQTGFIDSLGHREEYTFHQLEEDKEKLDDYKNKIQGILQEVRHQFEILKKEIQDLDPEIVSQLLLPLRYLVKDVSFKEEQECRIFSVKSLSEKNKKDFKDTGELYFNYLEVTKYVTKVILGAQCRLKGDKKFEENCKAIGIEVEHSRWPFEIT